MTPFFRPRRQATIRTRLDVAHIREQLGALADSEPEGMQRFLSHGYFTGGWVGEEREFEIDYNFNSHRNPQTYAVQGTIDETPDWRTIRLRLRAKSPWMDGWMLAGLVGFSTFYAVVEGRPIGGMAVIAGFVIAVYAVINILYIPDVAIERASRILAHELHGSVLEGEHWVVPRD